MIAAWGLGWIVLTLLPVAMLPLGEHFLYLPSLGYCILVGSQVTTPAAAPSSAPWPWAAIDARGRRALATVGGLVLLVCIGRTMLFASVARASVRTVEQAAAALDRAPEATRLLVADLPTGASLAFGLAISQVRHGQTADVGILSLLPAFTADAASQSVVTLAPPSALVLSRAEGFIHSYVERALAGPRVSFEKGETFEPAGYTVTVLDAPGGQLRAFQVRLSDPAHTLVLGESEQGLVPLGVGLGAAPRPVPAAPP